MTKYTFQTIVATSEVRAAFTVLREELKSSDKELMTAMFELASKHREELDQLVKDQQDIARGYRERSKELKAAAKVKLKPAAVVKVKKARKAKVVEVVEAVEPAGEWVAAAEGEELALVEGHLWRLSGVLRGSQEELELAEQKIVELQQHIVHMCVNGDEVVE